MGCQIELPCCLPWVDHQVDSADARFHWAKVCSGALRCKGASSATLTSIHIGLASSIALRGKFRWHSAAVATQMEASPCRFHLQRCWAMLCSFLGPVGPIGRAALVPIEAPILALTVCQNAPCWGHFWCSFLLPKAVPILGTGIGRF